MRPLLIVKTGRTLASLLSRRGDYEDWIASGLGLAPRRLRVASVFEGAALPESGELAGAVVTGSSAMVSHREPWSERAAGWLAGAARDGLPLLGICYGHQLLAHALGGRVGPNPRGREIGTVELGLADGAGGDALLGGLRPGVRVQATHVESVLAPPPGARVLASTALDPCAAFRFGSVAWGVQFHPEFDADVMRSYLRERSETLRAEGLDPDTLLSRVRGTPSGPAVLRRFAGQLRD